MTISWLLKTRSLLRSWLLWQLTIVRSLTSGEAAFRSRKFFFVWIASCLVPLCPLICLVSSSLLAYLRSRNKNDLISPFWRYKSSCWLHFLRSVAQSITHGLHRTVIFSYSLELVSCGSPIDTAHSLKFELDQSSLRWYSWLANVRDNSIASVHRFYGTSIIVMLFMRVYAVWGFDKRVLIFTSAFLLVSAVFTFLYLGRLNKLICIDRRNSQAYFT